MKAYGVIALAVLVGCALAYAMTKAFPTDLDLELFAQRDTIRITDSVIVVRAETVTVRQRRVDTVKVRSDSLDTIVQIVDDSTVSLPDTVAVVPPLLLADLAANRATVKEQASLIVGLYAHDTTRLWQLDSWQKYARTLEKVPKDHPWALGGTVGYGCNVKGCGAGGTVGLSGHIDIPSPMKLLRALSGQNR